MLLRMSMKMLQLAICALIVTGLANRVNAAVIVNSGYDLLYTLDAEFDFMGMGGLGVVPFEGVPLGTFDFGSGPVGVGATDTILHRLSPVNLPDFPPKIGQTIPIEMVALSLQTVNPINWTGFGGIANEFVRTVLVQDLGSTMTIYNDMTFDSNLQFALQLQGVTSGALTPILPINFTQTGATWTHIPESNSVLINGVNHFLNGSDNSTDFFTGFADHGKHKTIDINAVPEPGSFTLLGLGLIGFGFACRNRGRRQRTMASNGSIANTAS